ncbi:carbohydrate porin [bacterium]|nr:carbohydrate porin [bacterium]
MGKLKWCWMVLIFFLSGSFLFSEEKDLKGEVQNLKKQIKILQERIVQLESELKKKEGGEEANLIEGISVGIGATGIIQGTVNSDEDETDATISVDIEFEKELQNYGKMYLHLEGGSGEGIDRKGYFFSPVNTDAVGNANIDIAELWYEHYFRNLTITFGKLDPTCYIDQNRFANDETTQFLNNTFKNNQTIEFPDNTLGFHFLFDNEKFEIEGGFLDGDADWNEVFNNLFIFLQFNFKPEFAEKEGNYRVYGWMNNTPHTEFLNPSEDDEKNYGFGLSFDQFLTEKLGIFGRFGWENGKVSENEYGWSIGMNISGNCWGRKEDNVGIAFGQNIFSDDYKKAGNSGKTESIFEIYYSWKLNEHLTISPDVQVVWNAGGEDRDAIGVFGVRAQIDF